VTTVEETRWLTAGEQDAWIGVMGLVRKLWARWQPGAARLQANGKPGIAVPVPPDLTKESTT